MWLWVGDMDYDLNQHKADRREVRERETYRWIVADQAATAAAW